MRGERERERERERGEGRKRGGGRRSANDDHTMIAENTDDMTTQVRRLVRRK